MDNLIELLKDTLVIPQITVEDTVMDGSMMILPLMTEGLNGNGMTVTDHDYIRVYIFYKSERILMEKTKLARKTLQENNIAVGVPSYEYEKEGKIWRALFTVDIVGG